MNKYSDLQSLSFDADSIQAIQFPQMIRDMEFIRELLFCVEADPKCNGKNWISFDRPEVMCGHSLEETAYHLSLLAEADFIKANISGSTPMVARLTWQGHEFIDNTRDPKIWERTKAKLSGLQSVGLTVISAIAQAEIKKYLGLV